MSHWNYKPVRASARIERLKHSISDKDYDSRVKDKKRIDEKHKKGWQFLALQDLLTVRNANGGISKRGDIKKVVDYYNSIGYSFITKGSMNYSVMKHNEAVKKNLPPTIQFSGHTQISPLTDDANIIVVNCNVTTDSAATTDTVGAVLLEELEEEQVFNIGGRKKGSTVAKKRQAKSNLANAKTEATQLCFQEFHKFHNEESNIPCNTYITIIKEIEIKYNLVPNSISIHTIRSRIKRNNPTAHVPQKQSPIAGIEPMLVELCQGLAEMGAPLTKEQVMLLAASLMKGKEFEKDLLLYKKKLHLPTTNEIVGKGWYRGFIKRNVDKIKVGKGRIKDVKRHNWCTYENFENMYNSTYEHMIQAKVAIKTDEVVYYDINGNATDNPDDAFGRPTNIKVVNPENIIFVDECGSNTNMKQDGQLGGTRYVLPVGTDNTGSLGCTTDIHFTVLAFNNSLGNPLLCAIILKSEKKPSEIPITVRFGIDATIPLILTKEGEKADEIDLFYRNSGKGKAMQGGPDCFYKGRRIPCYVTCSPSASITSDLLADMLAHIDKHAQFDRSDGQMPFLLLDGHGSRFDVPFLKYIKDKQHPWKVCIGVPYGTHIWQVADSEQLNGALKFWLAKLKRQLFEIKRDLKENFDQTDIVPLVKKAFEKSFGNTAAAKKAVIKRGWNPLTYSLLDHPQIIKRKRDTLLEKLAPGTTSTAAIDPATSTTTDLTIETDHSTTDLTNYNTTTGFAATSLEKLLINRLKDDKYMSTLAKQKKDNETNSSIFKKLKELGRKMTSGIFANSGQFDLNEECLDNAVDYLRVKEKQKKDILDKRNVRTELTTNKYKEVKNKLVKDPSIKLTVHDMRTLMVHHRLKTDSPLKPKVNDLIDQFNRRKRRIDIDFPEVEKRIEKRVKITDTSVKTDDDNTINTCNITDTNTGNDLNDNDDDHECNAVTYKL